MILFKISFRSYMLALLFSILSATLIDAKVLVIAPHPDDDIITSAGVISRSLARGDLVKVVYMTNGDLHGSETGYSRQGEAVAAEGELGVLEDDLYFLGYPDGYLSSIYSDYISSNNQFVSPNGISLTYGNRGLGHTDYHSYRFGTPAAYNRFNILVDLEDIISTYMPEHIFVTSEFDAHQDHSTTYMLVSLAVAAIHNKYPNYVPVVHKTIVWWHNGSWPNPYDATSFFAEIPYLSNSTPLAWDDRESIDVPLSMQSTNSATNPKSRAISSHPSQGGLIGFLGGYIHKDEFFWVENLTGTNQPPIANAGLDQTVDEGQLVQLDGSKSRDAVGDYLSFMWVQRSGIPVQLSDAISATPTVTAPNGLASDEILTYELVVSDGMFSSFPDSVSINIRSKGPSNISSLASVTASSESQQTKQTAVKAVDGVIDGYPGDFTREWVTNGQGVKAWIRLGWAVPYSVDRVVLYDRPNSNDNIQGATITFSDGSSVAVGPLNNNGSATEVAFPARIVTSLTVTVTAVSGTSRSIGLAEIQVFGVPVNLYSLAVNVMPPGSGTASVNPNNAIHYQGEQVILTAKPNTGYAFAGWSGDAAGTDNPLTLTINSNRTVTANFTVLPGMLVVTPAAGLAASGAPGGSFAPSSATYTLQNTGNGTIDWSTSATKSWMTLSSTSGSLASGASTTVTVSINANATILGVGTYSDTISFTNLTNGNGNTTRGVSVVIAPANIALLAAVTASSESVQTKQTAVKAVDGVIDGYPGDSTREWVTNGQGVKAWIRLGWAVPYSVDRVVLYDRPNSNDNIQGATITFSDGSSVAVGPLNNNGSATEVAFPARIVTSLTVTVTAVSGTSRSIGLAEIQVFGVPVNLYSLAVNVMPPGSGTASVNPNNAIHYQGEQVILTAKPNTGYAFAGWSGDAAGTDNPLTLTINSNRTVTANFTVLPGMLVVTPAAGLAASGAPGGSFAPSSATYTLQNTGNGTIDWSTSATKSWMTLSSTSGSLASGASTTVTVSINANATILGVGTYSDTISFTNLTNGNGNTTRGVSVVIAPANIALLAAVTASSESVQTKQTAVKAVDGVIDGYPGDSTREWVTNGQGVKAWIRLGWAVPYSVDRVVLYDRPNSNDNIQGATITFSDGSSVAVGPLNNNGSATEVAFPARIVTSLTVTVTAVSGTSRSIGLAEIQVFGN